jgi:hypothetical protein
MGPKIDPHFMRLTTYGEDIIESNYNDDFQPAYETILNFLKEDDTSGLVLLDGDPGTGKTSIIKHFISMCSVLEKNLVVVPSAFASVLSEPSFLTFATNSLKESILLLEDAETALMTRGDGAKSDAVSNILNISDGILGSILNIKIVATINTNSNLDPALKRKGRLVAEYSFKKLGVEKAKKLAEKLGVDPEEIDEDTTLADIYNRAPNQFSEEKDDTVHGFRSQNMKASGVIPKPVKLAGFGGGQNKK